MSFGYGKSSDGGTDVSAPDESPGGHGDVNYPADPIIPVRPAAVSVEPGTDTGIDPHWPKVAAEVSATAQAWRTGTRIYIADVASDPLKPLPHACSTSCPAARIPAWTYPGQD